MDLSLLSDALKKIAYPPEMEFVERGFRGHGFYPACEGFVLGEPPIEGLMLLGRDFGEKSYYDEIVEQQPEEETSKTWHRMRDIHFSCNSQSTLRGLPIWCTNYLMGVRKEKPSTGNVKNRISPNEWLKYEDSCWKFLQKQVLLQRPRLIVIFGMNKQFRAANQVDLLTDHRLGTGKKQTLELLAKSPGPGERVGIRGILML